MILAHSNVSADAIPAGHARARTHTTPCVTFRLGIVSLRGVASGRCFLSAAAAGAPAPRPPPALKALGGERPLPAERKGSRKDKGKWREANGRRQLQAAIHAGVMPTPPPPHAHTL